MSFLHGPRAPASAIDSGQAWFRVGISMVLSTLGGVGMWSLVVALPAIQSGFGVSRAEVSLAYTLTMIGFGAGGIAMGRVADRFGIATALIVGGVALGVGYVAAGSASNLVLFALLHGFIIGIGSATSFGPLMADVSQWFTRRRGIAISVCAAGNYLSGVVWPPAIQHFIASAGWRPTYIGIGLFCAATMLPLALLLRGAPPLAAAPIAGVRVKPPLSLGLRPNAVQALLSVAGVACCVAMAMPQVHIVAYCGDLGYGAARGAQMLSLMLGCGIVSRIASGFVADRIGGLPTLLLGSLLQGLALTLYLMFDGLTSLYIVSALFGLFQGGIVPSYAVIIRECFPAREAGTRLGIVLMATLIGMALGGWLSGEIYDITGSYQAAFANGIAWNLLNGSIAAFLVLRQGRRMALA